MVERVAGDVAGWAGAILTRDWEEEAGKDGAEKDVVTADVSTEDVTALGEGLVAFGEDGLDVAGFFGGDLFPSAVVSSSLRLVDFGDPVVASSSSALAPGWAPFFCELFGVRGDFFVPDFFPFGEPVALGSGLVLSSAVVSSPFFAFFRGLCLFSSFACESSGRPAGLPLLPFPLLGLGVAGGVAP